MYNLKTFMHRFPLAVPLSLDFVWQIDCWNEELSVWRFDEGSIESWEIIVMYPIRFRYSANIYNPYIYIQYARKLPFTSM